MLRTCYYILRSLRPQQWTKNLLIFAPLIFSKQLFVYTETLHTIFAFFIFCLISGSVYLLNDLIDLENDKRHPLKCKRPLASGKLSPRLAGCVCAALLCICTLAGLYLLNAGFLIAAASYLVLQILYSTVLKHVVIIDVFCIAAGFVLRVIAGAEAIGVDFSTWLLFCTLLLALFLALSKRRHELLLLEDDAVHHRKILFEYSSGLLDQMIAIVTPCTLIAYMLYTIADDTVSKFGTDALKYTVPFVLYGIFRYLYLIHQKNEGGSPEKVLLNDRPILLTVICYGLTCALIVYWKTP
jgi:4-hydroxybenzoate polyprenyltransferase